MHKTNLAILGLGSRSTIFYLNELNILYNKIKGGYSTCPFILLNTNFNTINSLLPNPSSQLDKVLSTYVNKIEALDITHLLIPNITLHETIDRIKTKKNILHPIALTIKKIKQNNWNTVVLFGSFFSMNSTYIKNAFNANGIKVVLPSQEDMLFIDEVRKRIYSETESMQLIEKYHSLLHNYSVIHPVILCCTELSILKPKNNELILDMAEVQLQEAVQFVM